MKVAVCFRQDVRHTPVVAYPHCYVKELRALGHEVDTIGEGHDEPYSITFEDYDLFLEIDNGRGNDGKLHFIGDELKPATTRAVVLVDSHGHPDLHKHISKSYDHVFFAVYARRDLFVDHPSAHWMPNTTDLDYFGYYNFLQWYAPPEFDFGFMGSKMGLSRADDLVELCKKHDWDYDVREVVKGRRHRWPATGKAMARCRYLFNRGQKHDSPNQRVMESMAMKRCLLTNLDNTDGMQHLFREGEHFIGYKNKEDMEEKMKWMMENEKECNFIAQTAFDEVARSHTVKSRVKFILEVINAS